MTLYGTCLLYTSRKKRTQATRKKNTPLIDIEAKLQAGKGGGYERWAKVFNVKQLIIAVRITADVSVTVLGCTPFLDGTCQMQGGILCRMGEGVGHFGDLTCRVCVEDVYKRQARSSSIFAIYLSCTF